MTFLFTDIEESTRLLALLGPAYGDVLDQHHTLLRPIWAEHRAYEIEAAGDSFLLAFDKASDALRAAIHAQQRLIDAHWPNGHPVRVRMGIHAGFARADEGKYSALAFHQTAQLLDAANGGQVLVSTAARAELSDDEQAQLQDLGRFRVRDFRMPQELYRVERADLPSVPLPPRVRPMDTCNLSPPLTPFIGRTEELERLRRRVSPGSLVTLVGAGGTGKTRLATEFGLANRQRWPDGVWFVALESVQSPDHVAEVLQDALGAPRSLRGTPTEDVLGYLADRHLLIVLDNCEHLLSSCAELSRSIQHGCPGVGILATSQTALGLPAESCLSLAPLATEAGPDTLDSIPAAVRLFLERSGHISEQELNATVALCKRLDGMPYAIELAAARAAAATPSAMLTQLDGSADPLASDDPTIPQRHRSIDGVIDWSVALLDDAARELLQSLAAFPASFSPALAAVAADHGVLSVPEVSAPLWQLISHSLVIPDRTAGGHRYTMPELVRAYARRHCTADDWKGIVRRLGQHFVNELGPDRAHRFAWRSRFAAEAHNVRGLIPNLAPFDPAAAQALASSVCTFASDTGAFGIAVQCGEDYRSLLTAATPNRVVLLVALCRALISTGRLERAGAVLDEAKATMRTTGLPPGYEAKVAGQEIVLTLRGGDVAGARRIAKAALAGTQAKRARAHLYNSLAMVEAVAGNLREAVEAEEQALALSLECGIEINLQRHYGNLAESCLQLGEIRRAAGHQLQALDLARSNDLPLQVAFSMLVAARIAAARDNPEAAVVLNRAGLDELERLQFVLMQSDRQAIDQLLASTRRHLGDRRFSECEARAHRSDRRELELEAEATLRSVA